MTGQQLFNMKDELCETGLFWLLRGLTQLEFMSYQYLSTEDTYIAKKHKDIV